MERPPDTTLLLRGVLLAVAGLILLVFPLRVVNILTVLVGIAALFSGIVGLVNYLRLRDGSTYSYVILTESIIDIILGIILVLLPELTILIVSILLGIWVITGGVFNIFSSVFLRRLENKNWWIYLIIGLLIMVLGITIFVHPVLSTKALMMWIGIVIIAFGSADLYRYFNNE